MLSIFIHGEQLYDGVVLHLYIPAKGKQLFGVIAQKTSDEGHRHVTRYDIDNCTFFCGHEFRVMEEIVKNFIKENMSIHRLNLIKIGDATFYNRSSYFIVDKFIDFLESDSWFALHGVKITCEGVSRHESIDSGDFYKAVIELMLGGDTEVKDPLFKKTYICHQQLTSQYAKYCIATSQVFPRLKKENPNFTEDEDTREPEYLLQFGGLLLDRFYVRKKETINIEDKGLEKPERFKFIYIVSDSITSTNPNEPNVKVYTGYDANFDWVEEGMAESDGFDLFHYREITEREYLNGQISYRMIPSI